MTMPVPDWVMQQIQAGQYGQAGPMSVPGPNASTTAPSPPPYAPQFVMDAVAGQSEQPGGMSMPGPNASMLGQANQAGGLPAALDWQPPSGPPPGGMSIPEAPPPAPISTLNYTPADAAPPEPPPQAPPDAYPGLTAAISQAARGSYRNVPEAVIKAAEQWDQQGRGPMPGRTPAETASNRRAYDDAVRNREETENEALLDRRLELMGAAERSDDVARREILRGRGYAQQMLDTQKEQAARKDAIDTRIGELDRLIEQQATARNVNPTQKYWTDKGAFGRLATGLALGFGAMGQALAGGQNVALEMVNREIDGEFARQRDLVDGLGLQIASKRALLGDMMQRFQSPEAAEAATRSALIGQAEVETRRQAALEKSAEARAEMTSLADQLALQRAGLAQAATEGERRTLYQWQPRRTVGRSGLDEMNHRLDQLGVPKEKKLPILAAFLERGPRGAGEALHAAGASMGPKNRTELEAQKYERSTRVVVPDHFAAELGLREVTATDPAQKKDLQEGLLAAEGILTDLDRLEKLVQNGTRLSPGDRAFAAAVAAKMIGPWRVKLGLGVMSESDKELVKPLTGGFVNDFSLFDRQVLINQLRSMLMTDTKMSLSTAYEDRDATQQAAVSIKRRKAH
jgi:hypothetical protein